ncbi:hypothetical protein F511_31280 [Dorcoceras hygrometricum]|uniref:Uncharacterized protein n=2 Tax=Dorcoceras hygrometricum TaxID=472368 RepID=A0A2Z7CHI1_9LAMI|nr:hypothetical protein F511_31280 [Dorcoceras hygrometricum]
MSSPDYDLVVRSAESIDHSSTPEASNREDENPSLTDNYRARILRIDQDEARLTARGCAWYEIKASTLKESDISYVKDKAGITSLYEVVIPHIHARAHRPPAGFHTFYINQIDRGLRFPLPTFIASLCHYIGVSPSQLAPNSYSSLLSLGILLKFHGIPLSTYVLMQLVTIKRLGPGKFYISNKKEFGFVGGNPSSHKGWMSDRMDKAAMLEALKERRSKTKSGGASRSGAQNKEEISSGAPSKEKREASPEKKERRKKRRHEKRDTGSTQEPIPEVTISEPEGTTNEGPKRKSSEEPYTLLDASKISFVSNPSGSASLDFIRHMVPDQDFDQLKRTPDLEVFESAGLHFMQSLAWFGEAASRFSKARAEVVKTKRSYDVVLGRHEVLLKQLEEIQTKENVEKESLTAELESARAEAQTYKAKVQSLEIQVQSLDARAHCAEEESKLRLIEVEKLQEERANSWALEKEKFLKSKDFDSLCLNKAVMYFDKGFEGCLAQFRANGFSEEEYPASFLNVEQALADMPEDQEEDSSGLGENPPA